MAWVVLTVVVVEILGYSIGAIWCSTYWLGFVVLNLSCSTSFTVDEHMIVIRFYGTPVVFKCSSLLSINNIDQVILFCVLRCIRYCKYGILLALALASVSRSVFALLDTDYMIPVTVM